jgi:hypothetical protein
MKIETHIALLKELSDDISIANNNYYKDIIKAIRKYFNYMKTFKVMEKENND